MDIETYANDPRTAHFAKEYKRLGKEAAELDTMRNDGVDELVSEEKERLRVRMKELEEYMNDIVKEEEVGERGADEIVLEIRAGAGGDEASIFARDLAAMYQRYATQEGFSFSPLSLSENSISGYKEAVFTLKGRDVYSPFRFETGVHRIQRVPKTEKTGRIHTSTASVAVLPIRKNTTAEIDMNDIKMEFSRSGGAGGQNVNKVESAVRMVHMPTGIEVRCTEERTQQRNRERALEVLTAKVDMHLREKERKEYDSLRRSQIGTADRSEKIRTYNILQDRVTDHRIKKNWSGVEGILAGDMDGIVTALRDAYVEEQAG